MRTVSLSKHLTAGSVNCVALSQVKAAAGNLTLNGGSVAAGVATLDTQRRLAIISAGNDSALTATITGGRESGQKLVETLSLANAGTVVTSQDFFTIGTVSVSGSIASTITIGTNGTGSTDWIMPNFHLAPFNVDITDQLTGSATWNLETTLDTYWDSPRGQAANAVPNVGTVVSGSTVAAGATLLSAVTGYRFTITSGTGTLAAQATQAGIVNY